MTQEPRCRGCAGAGPGRRAAARDLSLVWAARGLATARGGRASWRCSRVPGKGEGPHGGYEDEEGFRGSRCPSCQPWGWTTSDWPLHLILASVHRHRLALLSKADQPEAGQQFERRPNLLPRNKTCCAWLHLALRRNILAAKNKDGENLALYKTPRDSLPFSSHSRGKKRKERLLTE